MNFVELKRINSEKIQLLKNELAKKQDDVSLADELLLHNNIAELLEADEGLFFNIKIDEAFQILSCIIDDNEEVKQAYMDLTSPQEYKRLMDAFKV